MNNDDFRAHVAANEEYKARHDALALQLEVKAKNSWNVQVQRDELIKLPAFRLFVLTGEMIGDIDQEFERDIDAVRQAKKTSEVQEALANVESDTHDVELAKLNALRPDQRIAAAREMGMQQQPRHVPVEAVTDPVERAKIANEISKLPVSMRISAARARGVV